jgi:hypothetical protein
MPSSNRQKIREEVDSAIGDLTKAGQRLLEVRQRFAEYDKTDWVAKWTSVIQVIDGLIDILSDLRDQI